MKQLCFICIFLSGCYTISAQESVGDSLFTIGEYQRAAVYFERAVFLDSSSNGQARLLLKKAYCYKSMVNYQEALDQLKRCKRITHDSLKHAVNYEKILLSYLIKDYEWSYQQVLLEKLSTDNTDPDLVILEVINLIALNRWQEARTILLVHQTALDFTESEIDEVLPVGIKPKNTNKAGNLSTFLPGLGQIYAGYPVKGLMSGGIQAALVGGSAFAIYKGYFFSGGMTGVALFYTFYFGGIRHSRELANRKNQALSKEMTRALLERHKKTLN